MDDGANGRIIKVINFLTAHPEEAFTVSELAERLSLSLGSAHRVLTTLTRAGYLSRHRKQKSYSLGLALLAIGQVAMERHRVVDIAQREMGRIAEEFGTACLVSALSGEDILYLAKRGAPTGARAAHAATRVGDRRPFVPPLGLCFVAWATPAELAAYLERAPAGLSEAHAEQVTAACRAIRERGYSIAALDDGIEALGRLILDHVNSQESADYWQQLDGALAGLAAAEIQLLDLDELASRPVGHLSAPVFGPGGEVVLELTVAGIAATATRADVERLAARLTAAAALITAESYGRRPEPPGSGPARGRADRRPGRPAPAATLRRSSPPPMRKARPKTTAKGPE